ncbi:MAG: GTPase Era [Gammaproteobacteria bacterium]
MTKRAGYVALLGRPNVGKSTLLNQLVGQKLSITSPKPQTTRHALLGIKTLDGAQIVYVDTPGLHRTGRRAINRYMNRAASATLDYVNVVVWVVEALRWNAEDSAVLERLRDFPGAVVGAVSKIDRLDDKARLLPFLQELGTRRAFAHLIPIAALTGDNLAVLEQRIVELLPEAEFLFPTDQITTASERFLAAELIREKLTRALSQELPYALAVDIEQFTEEGNLVRIGAVIWVERPGQKSIVIGADGALLKKIGQQARRDLEVLLGRKVFLETWVKVRADWPDDESALHSLGYHHA